MLVRVQIEYMYENSSFILLGNILHRTENRHIYKRGIDSTP